MYLLYNNSTGQIMASKIRHEINAQAAVDGDSSLLMYSYEDLIEANYYFPSGVKTARSKLPVDIGPRTIAEREVTTITGIPVGTRANLLAFFDETINDGELLIDFDLAGSYILFLENFPYKPMEVIYHVY